MGRVYTLGEIDASLPVSERESRIQLPRREAKRFSQRGFKEEYFTPHVVSLLAILNKPDFTILPIFFAIQKMAFQTYSMQYAFVF